MKLKRYENYSIVLFLSIFIIFIELCFFTLLSCIKEYKYEKISGIVVKKNLLMVVASPTTRKILYKNKYLYSNDKKIKYEIIEEQDKIDDNYNEILIKYNFNKEYKDKETISISVKKEKYKLIEIFKIIWDGD